jgi:hypothetical protein
MAKKQSQPYAYARAACGTDSTRINLTRPFLTEHGGHRWIVGTDGRRLHLERLKPGVGADIPIHLNVEILSSGAIVLAPDADTCPDVRQVIPQNCPDSCLVELDALRQLTAIKCPPMAKSQVRALVTEQGITLAVPGLVSGKVPAKAVGVFPPYLASAIGFETKAAQVRVRFRGPLDPLVVTPDDSDPTCMAIIMPIRV